jgi:hypothetical protein
MSSLINDLTRNVRTHDVRIESERLVEKWEEIGLLEGLKTEYARSTMARILENQAMQVLHEVSTMAGGNVEGFAAVAFPIVRRVFGNLIATDLVSVQSMILPNGMIFFLDYTYNNSRLAGQVSGESVFGQGVVGSQITNGVDLTLDNAEKSAYSLNNGYTLPTASFTVATTVLASGTVGSVLTGSNADLNKMAQFDPDLSGSMAVVVTVPLASFSTGGNTLNEKDFVAISMVGLPTGYRQARRLTKLSGSSKTVLTMVVYSSGSTDPVALAAAADLIDTFHAPIIDQFTTGGSLGSVQGTNFWGLENDPGIPEINVNVDSIAITAITRKMKAVWTQELSTDLNAWHNIDAEVELSSLLAEHIELEINFEILEDLLKGATAAHRYWSRRPGKFLDAEGRDISNTTSPPDFTGNVSEWNQTIMDKINDVSAIMHRKLRRGAATFLVCSPEVVAILEFTRQFTGNVVVGDDKGTAGVESVGSLNKKFDVYVDPYFLRNVILIGRKGSSFLESGYVYAPYVPLQLTPIVYHPDTFVPRKGIATRYAKKMVLPDMYGTLTVLDLNG